MKLARERAREGGGAERIGSLGEKNNNGNESWHTKKTRKYNKNAKISGVLFLDGIGGGREEGWKRQRELAG